MRGSLVPRARGRHTLPNDTSPPQEDVSLRRIAQALKGVVKPFRVDELPGFRHRLLPKTQPVGYLKGILEDCSLRNIVLRWRRWLPSARLNLARSFGHEPIDGKYGIMGNHPCRKLLPLACWKASHLILDLAHVHGPPNAADYPIRQAAHAGTRDAGIVYAK